MRVLVCGSREWTERDYLFRILDAYHAAYPIHVLIEGEARGADRLSREWAEANRVAVEPYPADWEKYGRAAGPIRNRLMLMQGLPDTVIAFHRDLEASKGTRDMVRIARESPTVSHVYVVPFEGYRPPWSPIP